MLDLKIKVSDEESFYDLTKRKDIKVGEGVKINGAYSTDIDIKSIHLIIKDVFSYNIYETSNIEEKIRDIDKSIEKSRGSFLRYQSLVDERKKLKENLEKFSEKGWHNYIEKVKDILEKYSTLTTYKKNKKIYIGGSKKEDFDLDEDKKLWIRLELIRNFIRIAKNYIDIDILFHPPYVIGCTDCDLTLDEMNIDDEHGVYVCDCNDIFGRVYTTETHNIDPDKIDNSVKNSYDDKTNFIRRLKSYQGIQTRKIPTELLEMLDNHLVTKYRLPPAKEIREMQPDENGHKGSPKTSVKLLIDALKETGYSAHFQDINPICYELWGWVCPSIEHLVPTILDNYTKTQKVVIAED